MFGVFEAFYIFEVPDYKLSTQFLLFGVARNPHVCFEKPHINLKPTVLGVEVSEEISLKNSEMVTCNYRISKESLTSVDRDQTLLVEPLYGTLKPLSDEVIK